MHEAFLHVQEVESQLGQASPSIIGVVIALIGVRLSLTIRIEYAPRRIGHLPSKFPSLSTRCKRNEQAEATYFSIMGVMPSLLQ